MTPTPEPPEDHSKQALDMVQLDANLEHLRQVIIKQNQKHGRHRFHHPDEARIVRKPYADD
jgi:hypothetical protein